MQLHNTVDNIEVQKEKLVNYIPKYPKQKSLKFTKFKTLLNRKLKNKRTLRSEQTWPTQIEIKRKY